jgi:MFS family permease
MFDSVFLFKVFLSFLTGCGFTAVTLYAAEKYGPKFGGIIAGLPSTTAVGLFFIGYVQSAQAASQAATLMPAAVGGSLVFVFFYVALCKKIGYKFALLAASVVWLMIALPLAYFKFEDLYIATLFFLVVWVVSLFYMGRRKMDETMPEKVDYSFGQKISRAVFAGGIISFAVVISSLFGPLWGGALAAFPAMFLSTFIILCRAYGCGYSTAFAKNTPIGLFGVIPYLWGVHFLYPVYGLIVGTLAAYLLSFVATAAVYKIFNGKKKYL